MPTPTIPDGELFFNATLWTGTSTVSGRTFTNGAPGQSFQPDFIWAKSRSGAYNHQLYDSNRGTGKRLESNSTGAETTNPVNGYISSFNSNGFTTIAGSSDNSWFNETNTTYVAWQWKAGGAAVTNTAGSITSQVSANTTSGFSVVTYSIASASATISTFGHGLGVAPSMVILKVRNSVDDWTVYHSSITTPNSNWLTLNSTTAAGGATSTFSSSSTTFGVRETRLVAASGSGNIVAYCFAQIAGYSAFGSYTGNGSADGPFVYTNFQPRFVMWKRTDSIGDWIIFDTARDTFNFADKQLVPNTSGAEAVTGGGFVRMDFLSNGFKIRSTDSYINASGGTYIFMAFASNPFKYANAR